MAVFIVKQRATSSGKVIPFEDCDRRRIESISASPVTKRGELKEMMKLTRYVESRFR